jgi:predicted MPP superfamily phosphohydrolase
MKSGLVSFFLQELAVIAFVTCVVTVFSTALALVIRMLGERKDGKTPRALSTRDKCIIALAGIGILCVLYGSFIEPYWLETKFIHLTSDKIHSESRPVRIVQISDLHCDSKPRLEEKLPDVIAALKPDIIVFTGDSINTPFALPVFRKCLTGLASIAPTYVVKGNWDSLHFTRLDRFGGTGAIELDGTPVRVQVAGNDIWINGLPIGTTKNFADVMRMVPENAYRIFLFHFPDYIEEMQRDRVDLYLAGHTHGGQVALPLYGALITCSPRGKEFEGGLYRLGQTILYVNRGIGMEGGVAPRVRFCARPEITVFDISGKPQQ